jgi:hypothetical protein
MISFINPNNPQQPQKGVYGWYAKKDGKLITIYIGQAGKKSSLLPKGTLFRGVSELQRNTFSSNSPSYDKLDTDFIVGTAVLFFNNNGYDCEWKHIDNDPNAEATYVKKENPILQKDKDLDIKEKFKIQKSYGYWKKLDRVKVSQAEEAIFQQLSEYLV